MLNPGTGELFSSGHSQERDKRPLNVVSSIGGTVVGEFTDNFVHPRNQPLNKGRLGDMGWGWEKTY